MMCSAVCLPLCSCMENLTCGTVGVAGVRAISTFAPRHASRDIPFNAGIPSGCERVSSSLPHGNLRELVWSLCPSGDYPFFERPSFLELYHNLPTHPIYNTPADLDLWIRMLKMHPFSVINIVLLCLLTPYFLMQLCKIRKPQPLNPCIRLCRYHFV